MRGILRGLAVLGAGMLSAGGPAIAQQSYGAPQETPGDALSRNLKTLVANPRSVDALTGAGRAALDVGDAQAALSFLARAEDEAPRDGRIKMWIASALVQLEQPHAALKFFKDAADLGVPEAELARDRGLAYDIAGDPRRAQRDYRLALQRSRDPELTRRLALSLAISGEREPALRLLDEQLQSRNPAAERTRALVLALTGDAADASRAVEASMPGPQGEALMPFLARLPSLSLADRALAVHLGRFPQDGRSAPAQTYAMNSFRSNVVPASPNSSLTAGRPDPLQPGLGRSTATLVRSAPPEAADDQQAPPVRMQGGPPRSGSQMEMGVRRQPGAAPSASHAPLIALPHPLDIRRPAQAGDQVAPPVSHPPVPRQSRLADLAATVATLPGSTPAASTSPSPSPSAAAVPVAQQERVAAYGPKVPAAAAPAKAAPPAAKPEPVSAPTRTPCLTSISG